MLDEVAVGDERAFRDAELDYATRLGGLYESVGWSFAAPDLVDRLRIPPDDPRHAAVAIRNPMSADQSGFAITRLKCAATTFPY